MTPRIPIAPASLLTAVLALSLPFAQQAPAEDGIVVDDGSGQPAVAAPATPAPAPAPVVAAPALPAARPAPAPAPAPAAAPMHVAPAVSTPSAAQGASSTAALAPGLRDPFWPIGYRPKPRNASTNKTDKVEKDPEQAPPAPEDPPKWPDLRVTGFIKYPDGKKGATLDGVGTVASGQTISKSDGKYEYFWKIDSISDKGRLQATRLNVKKLKQ